MGQLNIKYNIYLEADDVAQSRILSSIAFVKNLMANCSSSYFKNAAVDDESDLDEFVLRFYIENEIHEAECAAAEQARAFVPDMAEFLDTIAAANSFMDMEGSFFWEYEGEKKAYQFRSEGGTDYCDFEEVPF